MATMSSVAGWVNGADTHRGAPVVPSTPVLAKSRSSRRRSSISSATDSTCCRYGLSTRVRSWRRTRSTRRSRPSSVSPLVHARRAPRNASRAVCPGPRWRENPPLVLEAEESTDAASASSSDGSAATYAAALRKSGFSAPSHAKRGTSWYWYACAHSSAHRHSRRSA
uniref:Uncharacterized protein n=1 Tax=Arundo donax TaxID=35708 RepID=A0A0A8ZRG8_ARUDO